jgi:DNA ligase-1
VSIPDKYKPNLAAPLTKPALIKFPVYCSPKIDGIRCTVFDGVAYSRSMKPIPNESVQAWAREYMFYLHLLDGELVVGSPTDPNCMQNSTSGVMRIKGEPEFSFHVFDYVDQGPTYERRLRDLMEHIPEIPGGRALLVPQVMAGGIAEMDHHEASFLAQGYEGMMIRDPRGTYKYGRSTEREGGLVKVKRFVDAEAVVVGFVEEMENTNEAKRDALGNTERSTAKAGLVGKGTLGALVVRDEQGREFNIGSGFNAMQRRALWKVRETLPGQYVTYKYFAHGIVDVPRHPVFKAFRSTEDMST